MCHASMRVTRCSCEEYIFTNKNQFSTPLTIDDLVLLGPSFIFNEPVRYLVSVTNRNDRSETFILLLNLRGL